MLFALGVDLVEHGGERGGFAGTRRAGDQHQAARLIAQAFNDSGKPKCVKSLDFPGNGTEHRSNGAALIEHVAAEARQVLQTERKVEFQILFEAMLLRVGQHAVCKRFGVSRRERRHVQRAQPAVNAHARRAVGGDVQVAASHLDHFLQ